MTIKLQNGSVPSAIKIGSTDVLSVRKGSALLWSTTPTNNVSLTFTPGSSANPATGPVSGTLSPTHQFNLDFNISTFDTVGTPVTRLRFIADTNQNATAFLNDISTNGLLFTNSDGVQTFALTNWSVLNNVILNSNTSDIADFLDMLGSNLPSPDDVTIT